MPIGDGRSAALVGPDGAVEFFCPMRFDAPALVFPILDRLRGGRLRVGPVESPGTRLSCRRHYRQASSVLTLEWFGASGSARMHMALKWLPQEQEQTLKEAFADADGPAVQHTVATTRYLSADASDPDDLRRLLEASYDWAGVVQCLRGCSATGGERKK
ncbi:hypothetical protein MOX01_37970 [Microbacterium oxydans]|uniref:hypothetical protein n=1 Tax=Microbacterium oxydans TaxID=82380 RepID=UPI001173B89D|nr:hypothetical protein [Microbacterium oxydans]GED40655.1 hypothetical protein MOX01_37970 [Microbacterium oxydans]